MKKSVSRDRTGGTAGSKSGRAVKVEEMQGFVPGPVTMIQIPYFHAFACSLLFSRVSSIQELGVEESIQRALFLKSCDLATLF